MDEFSIIHIFFIFIIVMLLSGIIFLRVKVGRVNSKDTTTHSYRRNNLVIAFIVMYFLFYWYSIIRKGDFPEGGMGGWKGIASYAVILIGIVSLILIIISNFRRRKK